MPSDATTDSPTTEDEVAPARRGPRPLVVAVLVLAIAGVLAGTWWSQREPGLELGDRGEALAVVSDQCQSFQIDVDGLYLGDQGEVPRAWRGREVSGRVTLTDRDDDTVTGVFTSDDGTEVPVGGGRKGETFFKLGCMMWG